MPFEVEASAPEVAYSPHRTAMEHRTMPERPTTRDVKAATIDWYRFRTGNRVALIFAEDATAAAAVASRADALQPASAHEQPGFSLDDDG